MVLEQKQFEQQGFGQTSPIVKSQISQPANDGRDLMQATTAATRVTG
jgi:hypothetical protein